MRSSLLFISSSNYFFQLKFLIEIFLEEDYLSVHLTSSPRVTNDYPQNMIVKVLMNLYGKLVIHLSLNYFNH